MVAAAIGGAAVLGSATSLMGGQQQAGAASDANSAQMQMYNQERNDLMPYMNTGAAANTSIANLTGINGGDPLSSPLLRGANANLTQANLAQTPGYQFNLAQGLKGVQNSAAARGLGSSGAALKGAAGFATGLADSTYQNQFNNQVTNQTNQFNRLMGLTQLGQSSAAGVGAAGVQTGQGIASNTIGAGNALAASTVGAGNALGSAGTNYLLYNALLGGGGQQGGSIGSAFGALYDGAA